MSERPQIKSPNSPLTDKRRAEMLDFYRGNGPGFTPVDNDLMRELLGGAAANPLSAVSQSEEQCLAIWQALPYDHESHQAVCPTPEDMKRTIREAARCLAARG